MKTRIVLPAAVIAAAALGWLAHEFAAARHPAPLLTSERERRVQFYQSAMHPWIKSDKPGKCTICGMDLVPIYEGGKSFELREGVVSLTSNQITVIQVETTPARRQPLRRTLRVAGTIDDNDQRHRVLSAYVDGRIDRLFANQLGAEVIEGQPLIAFYSPVLLTAVREYLALHRVGKTSRLGPEADPPAALPEDSVSRSLQSASALRLQQLGLTATQIADLPGTFGETNLDLELRAPVTGTVVAKYVYEGQYVKEGEKLLELADFSTMWFLFDAYERDLAWLRPGQNIELSTASLPGRVFTNRIAFIEPSLRDDTRSARVRVEIPNPLMDDDGRPRRLVRHRLYAEGRVDVELPEVLTVPRTAVLSPGSRPVVYVELGDGAYEQRPVTVGRAGDEAWEVLDGLHAGERVVTRGNLLIDAQAQLNRAGEGSTVHAGHLAGGPLRGRDDGNEPASRSATVLSPAQLAALREFLAASDRLRDALAADDLKRFNELAPKLHVAVGMVSGVLSNAAPWRVQVEALGRTSHLDPAPDLAAARRQFHDLSIATVALAKRLRAAEPAFAGLKIFQCPMTKRAFPGAPPRAEWLQLAGPIRNPYFGAGMIDCGTEVEP